MKELELLLRNQRALCSLDGLSDQVATKGHNEKYWRSGAILANGLDWVYLVI